MKRSIEQALRSLIPRHDGPLPTELVELSSSLLAQSRSKASNLKAEEEIGRIYACANIACERLKHILNLPKVEPRPPCPPRVYNKLYAYLDHTLISRKRSRPQASESATFTPARPSPRKSTPSKTVSLASYTTTPGSGAGPRRRGLLFTDTADDIAVWMPFAIRALCKELQAPAAIPHVLAGVTTILTQRSPSLTVSEETLSRNKKDKLPALIAAVYCFVGTRISGRQTSGKEYIAQRKLMLATLKKIREDEDITEKIHKKWRGKKDMEWEGWEDVRTKDVDAWLLKISSEGWLSLDWFENIVEGSGLELGGDSGQELDNEAPSTEYRSSGENRDFQRRGLGTMIQDKVDYLSEEKRTEYKIWKECITAKIEAMEKDRTLKDVGK